MWLDENPKWVSVGREYIQRLSTEAYQQDGLFVMGEKMEITQISINNRIEK